MVSSHPLRQYRISRGVTQEALGKELGVTAMTIWRWENRKQGPRRRDIPHIIEKTGLSPAEVLGYEKMPEAAG